MCILWAEPPLSTAHDRATINKPLTHNHPPTRLCPTTATRAGRSMTRVCLFTARFPSAVTGILPLGFQA